MKTKLLFIYIVLAVFSFKDISAQSNSLKNNSSLLNGWNKKIHSSKNQKEKISLYEIQKISEKIKEEHKTDETYSRAPKTGLSQLLKNRNGQTFDFSNSNVNVSSKNLTITWDENNNTPIAISNKISNASFNKSSNLNSALNSAVSFVEENKSVFKLENPKEELVLKEEVKDKFNMHHVVFSQNYKGVPIWGKEMVIHTNPNGEVYSVNARYSKTPIDINIQNDKIGSEEALKIAKQSLLKSSKIEELNSKLKTLLKYENPQAKKYIWVDAENKNHLVWFVQIRPNIEDNWYYFIDAASGEVLEKYNASAADGPTTTSAKDLLGVNRTTNVYQSAGTYYLLDATKGMWLQNQTDPINDPKGGILTLNVNNQDVSNTSPIYYVASNDNTWIDPAAISAHYNCGIVYDYYFNKHGRNAIDGNGTTMISIIHATQDSQPMDNAYWNGAFMVYGDGNLEFYPLAGALDVAAHEMTHGVIDHTVALEYKYQSGALNESFADVFGTMVDSEDWLLGEDVVKSSYFPSGALRNMLDPHNGAASINDAGWQPANMNEFLNLTIDQDNGGVHINSGIPNHACALIGEAIGKEKTAQIYYRILDSRYLNTQSQFIDLRLAAIQSATDLFGDNSAEVTAVKNAFDTVGILDGTGTKPPADVPAVEGEQWIAAVNAEIGDTSLYLIRPTIQSNSDIVQLTSTQVFSNTGNPISVTDDGSYILFIDKDNYIRGIYNDGTGESVLSTTGEWNSIAISPDGSKIAATSIYADASIYIFDLINSNNSYVIHLYNPTTQEGIQDSSVKYADALDWDLNSEVIVYDCFNQIPQSTGGNLEYWTVDVYDLVEDKIYNLFPPQREGISIGNPSFSQTSNNYLLVDYADFSNSKDDIYAIDLFNGNVALVESNESSIGFPRYSPDDSKIVFQRLDASNIPSLRQISLVDDKMTPASASEDYVTGGQLPAWFAIGSRPVSVEDNQSNSLPNEFNLSQNYPNPFNPSTTIEYQIPTITNENNLNTQLKIYDILGREITTLVNEIKPAGTYTITFNANNLTSGIYYYQLKYGDYLETKKMILMK